MVDFSTLFWGAIFLMFLWPQVSFYLLQKKRDAILAAIGRKYNSEVITLIHRQEKLALLGLPIFKFIDMDDAEKVQRKIRNMPKHKNVDIIIHSTGGIVLAASQIARAIKDHDAKIRVIVPHYAMSGGTLIALAADEILMDEHAVLGPVDPQILSLKGAIPARVMMEVAKTKGKKASDDTLFMAKLGEQAVNQVRALVEEILNGRNKKSKKIANYLTSGKVTHDYPITAKEAKKLGLPVKVGIPQEVYELMDTYSTHQ